MLHHNSIHVYFCWQHQTNGLEDLEKNVLLVKDYKCESVLLCPADSTWFSGLVPKINSIYCNLDGKRGEFVDTSHRVFNFNCLFKQYVMEWSVPV